MWFEAPRHLYPVCGCGKDATVVMVTSDAEWSGPEDGFGWFVEKTAVSLFCDECHRRLEVMEGLDHEIKSTSYVGTPDYVISGCLDSRRSVQ